MLLLVCGHDECCTADEERRTSFTHKSLLQQDEPHAQLKSAVGNIKLVSGDGAGNKRDESRQSISVTQEQARSYRADVCLGFMSCFML